MVKDGPVMETGVQPCPCVKKALGFGRRTSLPSLRPNHEKQPSPPIPQHQAGDHLGLEPSTATASSRLSSLGQLCVRRWTGPPLPMWMAGDGGAKGPHSHTRLHKMAPILLPQQEGRCCSLDGRLLPTPCPATPLPWSGRQDALPSATGLCSLPLPTPSPLPLSGSRLSPSPRP
nr:PREDICTED: uncharacterized protein LOC109554549 isoform X2 [Bos indicus]